MSISVPSQPTVRQDSELVASFTGKSTPSQLVSTAGGSDAIFSRDHDSNLLSGGYGTDIPLSREVWDRLMGETVAIREEPRSSFWTLRHENLANGLTSAYDFGTSWADGRRELTFPPMNHFGFQPSDFAAGAELGQIPFIVGTSASYADRMLALVDVPQEAPRLRQVNVQPIVWLRIARESARDSRTRLLESLGIELDRSRSSHAARSPRDIVMELSEDYGLNQLTTARAIGVTPTAVRKWRRGDQARPEHQDRLATLTALVFLLREAGKEHPAAWLEVPISSESTLTPIDLLASGRPELVLSLASDPEGVRTALNDFDPDWRRNYAPDRDYEVVVDSDGDRAVVPRGVSDI